MTAFYHETVKRAEDGEALLERGAGSEKNQKAREVKKASGQLEQSETANDEATNEGQSERSKAGGEEMDLELGNNKAKTLEQIPPGDSPGNDPSREEQTEVSLTDQPADQPAVCPVSSPPAQASKEPPDVSGLLQYSLESPGGACAASLSLMTLGLLSVYVSIPKQMVVVDSSLVNNDFVKR